MDKRVSYTFSIFQDILLVFVGFCAPILWKVNDPLHFYGVEILSLLTGGWVIAFAGRTWVRDLDSQTFARKAQEALEALEDREALEPQEGEWVCNVKCLYPDPWREKPRDVRFSDLEVGDWFLGRMGDDVYVKVAPDSARRIPDWKLVLCHDVGYVRAIKGAKIHVIVREPPEGE